MKKVIKLKAVILAMGFLVVSAGSYANDMLGIKIDSPTWCMGQNKLGQCVTYFGSKKACDSVRPCTNDHVAQFVAPVVTGDLHYCYGMNSLDQCVLYLGSRESCANVNPCVIGIENTKLKY